MSVPGRKDATELAITQAWWRQVDGDLTSHNATASDPDTQRPTLDW